MRIMVVGGGAREHAIAAALYEGDAEVYAYMPNANPEIKELAAAYLIGKMDDVKAAAGFAKGSRAELAVIGPEAPLAAGMADELEKEGIRCVGPDKEHAQLETSKKFTRNLLQKHEIEASPRFRVFDKESDSREMEEFIDELGEYVVKPDGLTGGKGVKVSGEHLQTKEEALLYCHEVIGNFDSVVVEEKLEGEEFSLQTLTDGKSFLHFPVVQDHKRAFENDEGPNTGGMGSYSDANLLLPFLKSRDVEEAKRITEKVAAAIEKELGKPYRGVMYGGFMKTASGIKLLEYNARFGDPEAMNVLPLLKTNFAEICKAAAEGKLGEIEAEFRREATVCKYVVPEGYPDNPKVGKIEMPEETEALTFFASVEEKDGELWTTKSRGIAFVGIGETIKKAEKTAEEAASQVKGAVHHRKDIGTVEMLEKRIEHMRKLEGGEDED